MHSILPNEKLAETKTCTHCGVSFDITDKDLEFYNKISPVFAGVKYPIPSPTLCPDCRQQRRLSFRNERKLYKRKCDLTGKDIISIFSPDKPFKVYEQSEWWSDKWDPMEYGRDFDFSRGFFEQFGELKNVVPFVSLVNVSSENSDYCSQVTGLKDSYLSFASSFSEGIVYSRGVTKCSNCIDCLNTSESTNCYSCVNSENCHNSHYLIDCENCSDCYGLIDCIGCKNCVFSSNLINKEYYINNVSYSPEEYFSKIIGIKNNSSFFTNSIKKNLEIFQSEDCLGNEISGSKNIFYSFNITNSSYSKFCYECVSINQCYDFSNYFLANHCYEAIVTGKNSNNCLFTNTCLENVHNVLYSEFCYNNSSHLFGCTGLRNKQYCILNKQYTKEEYEALVPKIIEHMRKMGEWGEFFPSSLSPFSYNETVAQEYFPLDKDSAIQKGFNWSDYEPPFPRVEKIIPAAKLPEDIAKIPDDILNWAIECEVTGKPFRIIKQELEFYRKHNLPIPRRHPDQRHLDRMNLRDPRKLFERKCDKCGVEMMTTYSPERPEIVYCEGCYEKEVY